MSLIYYFDTSAINKLLDDPEREQIVTGLLSIASFRISALNVIEAAKESDSVRKISLITLMNKLANNKRPLNRPNTILLNCMKAFSNNASNMEINRDEDLAGLWTARVGQISAA